MAKLIFLLVCSASLAGLTIEALRTGPKAMLGSLARGIAWVESGEAPMLSWHAQGPLWLAHACGLAYLWRLSGRGYAQALGLGLASAAVLLTPQVPALLLRRRLPLNAAPLNAFLLPYVIAVLCGLHVLGPAVGLPALLWATVAATAYMVVAQAQRLYGSSGPRSWPLAVLLLLAAVGAWIVLEYLWGRTRGVTGSDPYCYAQMAVDLARLGDPRHLFTLFPLIRGLGVSWWPIVHVGYYPPAAPGVPSPTVWPVGWPVLLAGCYRLLGESGLYLGAPLAGLLALGTVAALMWDIWPGGRPGERALAVVLAVTVLGTSREQVLQVLVPMADVPAQLFSSLAVWLALRAGRRGSWPVAGLAGAMLGLAYDIRHTQVLLAGALALGVLGAASGRWRRLLAAGGAAALLAVPDLWYHAVALGSPWRPESPEIGLIGVRYLWGNALRMARALGSMPEYGLLIPLVGYGLWRLWRERRREAGVLVTWLLLDGGVQLLYGPVRLRDLLVAMPPLALAAGYGAVALLQRIRSGRRLAAWAPGWAALGIAALLALRSGPLLAWPWQQVEMNFGYLTGEQRQAFDRLGALVEADAVIGTSLNSGPVELYTGRETYRPGDWSAEEMDSFLSAMRRLGKAAYILDDGNEHAAVVGRLQAEGRLAEIGAPGVPLYGDRERLSGVLYRVLP